MTAKHTPRPRASISPGIKTRCRNCGGPLATADSIAEGIDQACKELLSRAAPALAAALEDALATIRALRGLAFTGSRIPTERYPEKAQADDADEKACRALRAAGRLP